VGQAFGPGPRRSVAGRRPETLFRGRRTECPAPARSAYSTTQQLKGLTPVPHSVQVEFVAIDHLPFRNRVIAAVLFSVK
jgi:hypothetical protein